MTTTTTGDGSKGGSEHHDIHLPIAILQAARQEQGRQHSASSSTAINWDDRLHLQSLWTLQEKGWNVQVEWKSTPLFGVGLFAVQDIPGGTMLRQGIVGRNLFQFETCQEIEDFCRGDDGDNKEYQARLQYVSNYLWGFDPRADERGYSVQDKNSMEKDDNRFFGMWIPGNGLNHSNTPNTVYRPRRPTQQLGGKTNGDDNGIVLVALCDIQKGQELYDDYRRHGPAPEWLRQFAASKGVSLNFAECNDFVVPSKGNGD